jgi:hypothetical protein
MEELLDKFVYCHCHYEYDIAKLYMTVYPNLLSNDNDLYTMMSKNCTVPILLCERGTYWLNQALIAQDCETKEHCIDKQKRLFRLAAKLSNTNFKKRIIKEIRSLSQP